MHVSKNHLAGSFQEVPPRDLLDACKRTLFTGTISVHAGGKEGSLQLRAGVVDEARFDGAADRDRAVAEVCKLTDGMYEVEQLLPDLSGALASSAQLDGDVGDVPLASIMRHCEDNALSCTLIVVSGFDRGEVVYRTGEIKDVRLNGEKDEDAIVRLVAWKDARFRVQAAPLDPAIKGHPKVSREPTAPFRLGDAARAAEVGTAPDLRPDDAHARRVAHVAVRKLRAERHVDVADPEELGRRADELHHLGHRPRPPRPRGGRGDPLLLLTLPGSARATAPSRPRGAGSSR